MELMQFPYFQWDITNAECSNNTWTAFKAYSRQLFTKIGEHNISLAGSFGWGSPEITDDHVAINGKIPKNAEGVVLFRKPCQHYRERIALDNSHIQVITDNCHTELYPYHIVVDALLHGACEMDIIKTYVLIGDHDKIMESYSTFRQLANSLFRETYDLILHPSVSGKQSNEPEMLGFLEID